MPEENREYLFKEIDVIQGIIKRMADNSFHVKTWAVTLVVGSLLLKGSNAEIFLAFVPLVAFWTLDAYFLRREKLYRKLYDWVIANRGATLEHLLDMDVSRFEREVGSGIEIGFSKTLLTFYGSITLLLVTYYVMHFISYCSVS